MTSSLVPRLHCSAFLASWKNLHMFSQHAKYMPGNKACRGKSPYNRPWSVNMQGYHVATISEEILVLRIYLSIMARAATGRFRL